MILLYGSVVRMDGDGDRTSILVAE